MNYRLMYLIASIVDPRTKKLKYVDPSNVEEAWSSFKAEFELFSIRMSPLKRKLDTDDDNNNAKATNRNPTTKKETKKIQKKICRNNNCHIARIVWY